MKYLIGYTIQGHVLIEAGNPQAAAAEAIGLIRSAARSLEAFGENEYRCPDGGVIDMSKVSPGDPNKHLCTVATR